MSSIWLEAALAGRWTNVSESASSAGSARSDLEGNAYHQSLAFSEELESVGASGVFAFPEWVAIPEHDAKVCGLIAGHQVIKKQGLHWACPLLDEKIDDWQAKVAAITVYDDPTDFWRTVTADAQKAFRLGWVRQAAALGWSEVDLFGLHPTALGGRLECMGLIPLLRGRQLRAITRDRAAIDADGEKRLTFYRVHHGLFGEMVPLWVAAMKAPNVTT